MARLWHFRAGPRATERSAGVESVALAKAGDRDYLEHIVNIKHGGEVSAR